MVGLDAAGKTTILYWLKLGQVTMTIPTLGFNVKTMTHKNLCMTVWDIGGQQKIRQMWRHYLINARGVIFVVDSSDRDRVDDAREELHNLLRDDELRTACLLVYANKQDLPEAMKAHELQEKLGLHELRGRQWIIQPCRATTGEGLHDGLNWLASTVLQQRR